MLQFFLSFYNILVIYSNAGEAAAPQGLSARMTCSRRRWDKMTTDKCHSGDPPLQPGYTSLGHPPNR